MTRFSATSKTPGRLAFALTALLLSAPAQAGALLEPTDLAYLGAFRLPDAGERPDTFAWGGNAMTFRPAGDSAFETEDIPGSLYIMGHDRMAYGELPDGGKLAEVSIPLPVATATVGLLPTARFLQGFHDVAAGQFEGLDELPRTGLAWLDTPASGPKLHLSWGAHFQPDLPVPSHAFVSPDLSAPDFTGPWYVGEGLDYTNTGYLFAIPDDWAMAHLGHPALAAGRFRDGGWSGMGPSLYAYTPFEADGRAAPPGGRLDAVPLIQYATSTASEAIDRALDGYQHPDEWEGGAWVETTTDKTAVLFAGTKSVGERYWYGFKNPESPDLPCVAQDFVGQFPVCRRADGTPCPDTDLTECTGHDDFRGWQSTRWQAQILFYDPDDLARVADGRMDPSAVQPYAKLPIDDRLYLNPDGVEEAMLGTGPQRRYRIGAMAWDPEGGYLFVLELFAESDKPVVHVWGLR